MKRFILKTLKIFLISVLVYIFIEYITSGGEKKFNYNIFLDDGIFSVFLRDLEGNSIFDFQKLILALSIYFLADLDIINHFSNYSEGYKNIVKFHSKSRFEMVKNIAKTSFSEIARSGLIWLFIILLPLILLYKSEFSISLNYLSIIFILGLNAIYTLVIAIVSSNSITTIVLFLIKHFIFSAFYGIKVVLFLLLIMIIVLYIKFGDRLGDEI